ncbi:MAG: DEAD/DEAH box helicase [Deltaproteobacteria bacterium]|nr:DEAD/DEAH box helicase [Deltaproteobacteria bacterium]
MSIADVTETLGSGVVAWLRFVKDEDGNGIRAGLFQTTPNGAPVSFRFTRARMGRQSVNSEVMSRLSDTLFGGMEPCPVLVLTLAAETPRDGVIPHEPSSGSSVYRVVTTAGLKENREGRPGEVLRTTRVAVDGQSEHLDDETVSHQLLNQVLCGADPTEPFERTRRGLDEAFADPHVQALTATSGLVVVVSLTSLQVAAESSESPGSPGYRVPAENDEEGNAIPRDGLTLAERLWAVLAAPTSVPRESEDHSLSWPGELMPFQKDGVRALLENERLLLADDMGLGKTVQAIAALRILQMQGEVKTCLVAAPASLLDQWRRELAKWAPDLSAIIVRGVPNDRDWQWNADVDVTLISYDTLRADFSRGPELPLRGQTWDLVVADEAQRIKNRNDTSRALKGLRRRRSWALTGTPIENHEEELASILEFVDHDDGGLVSSYYPGVRLQARHRELQVRRKKADVLADLPPKQTTKVTIDLNPRQRESYDKAEKEGIVYLKSLGTEVGVEHVLQLITRLKQICNADPKTGESSKLADIRERLLQLSAQGHKALVFSQYTSEVFGVTAAAQYLSEFGPLSFTGAMNAEEREAVVQRFKANSEHRALVLSLRAGGLGLNLQEASYVFHLDRWWNPAVERQAEDRSHRMGQPVKVNVIKYSSTGTIEQRIDEILERKQKLFDELVDDVSLDLSAQMTREELFGLFALEATVASPGRR